MIRSDLYYVYLSSGLAKKRAKMGPGDLNGSQRYLKILHSITPHQTLYMLQYLNLNNLEDPT